MISVIIPVFNRVNVLEETLNSILSQTYSNWECILIDDGSTDESLLLVEKYVHLDNRFRVFERPKTRTKGPSTCRNIGLEKVKGNYVFFLDSDDLLASFCLEDRYNAFSVYPEADFLVFDMGIFEKDIPVIKKTKLIKRNDEEWISNFIQLKGSWQTTAPIYKTDFVKKIGGFCEQILIFEDFEIALRALQNSTNYYVFTNIDYFYRNDEDYFKKHIDFVYEKKVVDAFVKFIIIMNDNIILKTYNDELQRKYKTNSLEAYITIFQRYIIPNVLVFKKENKEMINFLYKNKYINEIRYFRFLVVHHFLFKFHKIKGLGLYRLISVLMK